MEKRVDVGDGRILRVVVNDDNVADPHDVRPPIESDPDDLDEGATVALILVEPKPSTMTMEGAIAAVGVTARYLAGGRGTQQEGTWWHDWGKYVALLALVMLAVGGVRFL
jgi:hypothetical protein